MDQSYI